MVIYKICTYLPDENTVQQIIKKPVLADRLQELYGRGGFRTKDTSHNPTQQEFSLTVVLHRLRMVYVICKELKTKQEFIF